MKIITKLLASITLMVSVTAPIVSSSVYAANYDPCDPKLGQAVLEANNCPGTSNQAQGDISGLLISIANAIISILSVVAVIVIVIGGVQYITSTGEAAKLQKAKTTILYAVIGLIISALAGVLVNFVVAAIVRSQNAVNYTSKSSCEREGYSWVDGKCQ